MCGQTGKDHRCRGGKGCTPMSPAQGRHNELAGHVTADHGAATPPRRTPPAERSAASASIFKYHHRAGRLAIAWTTTSPLWVSCSIPWTLLQRFLRRTAARWGPLDQITDHAILPVISGVRGLFCIHNT